MAKKPIEVETLTHGAAKRRNIPTAELQSLVAKEDAAPAQVRYPRETPLEKGTRRARNPDLDPRLVWRGKDEQDWSDLIVQAPPLYVQEKVHPKAIIADLLRDSARRRGDALGEQISMFDDFNGLPDHEAKHEFYEHDQNWSNRFILGDSLQMMASLAEKEGLRGQVQCIYFDPPYGIKFNSNWQVSTRSRDVKDGKIDQISREPEQVKAFRDTWKLGVNSYLTYLRDRLTVARDLLCESGSIFVQIGDENVHRVRAMMDEVFGPENLISTVTLRKTAGQDERLLNNVADYIVWFARSKPHVKYREVLVTRSLTQVELGQYSQIQSDDAERRRLGPDDFNFNGELKAPGRPFRKVIATSSGHGGNTSFAIPFQGLHYAPKANRHWSTHLIGMGRLAKSDRLVASSDNVDYVRFFDDFIA